MTALKALIWDVDGTMADTERDGHRPAFNRAFEEVGLDWEWSVDLYGELLAVTGGKERIQHYCRNFLGREERAEYVADLHRRKTRRFLAMLETGAIPLRPGVKRLLEQARASGVRLAIATTTTPANVEFLLRANLGEQALDWFDVIGAGDIVPSKKPAPDIYEHVLAELGLPASECLALEDSRQGLISARAAGLPTLVTVSSYTQKDPLEDALAVLDHLGEPGNPCKARVGTAPASGQVDLDWLQGLLS